MGISYSIIIPHRNIPDLLVRCLDSIPVREDVQVIVVDDNSDAESVEKLKAIELRYSNVLFKYTKEGKGAGYARNVGLDLAEGKWLLFADADDFFHEGMLGMLDKWKDSDNQIVFFKTDSVDSETLEERKSRLFWLDYNYLEDVLYFSYVPWGKMVRSSHVKNYNIRFEEIEASNDVMFSLKSSYYADNVSLSQDVLYCATWRNDSLITSSDSKQLVCRINVVYRFNRFFKDHHMAHREKPLRYLILLKEVDKLEYVRQFIRVLWKGGPRMFLSICIFYLKKCFREASGLISRTLASWR